MLLRPFVRNGRPGLIGTMAARTVVVSTGKAAARPESARPPAAPDDPIGQLKELAALRERGVLTEEELAAQKARILGP
jgi:TPP-dependent pyruvate/acetoin dehydrogenase alpha subunit